MNRRYKIALLIGGTTLVLMAQQPVAQGPQASNAAAWKITGNGTAGSSDTNVVTVQGIASGTNLPISGTVTANAGTGPFPTALAPQSSSTYAFTVYHASSAAAANIKASAGNLYELILGNSGSVPCWLQLFNNSGTPTAGTSVVDSIMVQAGVTIPVYIGPENFTTGIAAAGATTDSGATTTGCTTTFSVSAYYK